MPPTNACPRCGRPSPPNVTFCASCGSHLSGSSGSSASSGKGWKLLLGAVALFAGLLWVSVLYTRQGSPTPLIGEAQPQGLLGPGSGATQAAQVSQPTPLPSLTLTSAQHLAEARRALADGYKQNKDPQKTQWGEVSAAKWHLKAITASAHEYREGQELLREVARRERQIELAKKKAVQDEDEDEDSDATAEADAASDDDHSGGSSPARPAASSPADTASSSPTATREATSSSTTGGGGGSSSDYYTNSRGVQVRRPTRSDGGPPPGASAQCRDGSYSFSQSRRGTCSGHGGVARWL